jgi:LysM repeat protein
MAGIEGRPARADTHVEDALSLPSLALAVAACVVGTVLTTRLGTGTAGTLAGAAIPPVIVAILTTGRTGLSGRLRVIAVVVLTLAALFITIAVFTIPESITGRSLIAGRPATFIELKGGAGPTDARGSETPSAVTTDPSLGPTEATSPVPTEDSNVYVVKSGDTLSSIADRFYGDPELWRAIARANEVADPDTLAVGTRLEIPPDPPRTEG